MGEPVLRQFEDQDLTQLIERPEKESLRVALLTKGLRRQTSQTTRAATESCHQASTFATPSRSALVEAVRSGRVDVVLLRADQLWSRSLTELLRTVGGPAPILIGLVEQATELQLREFVSWGGDDLSGMTTGREIATRLRSVERDFQQEARKGSGTRAVSLTGARQFVFLSEDASGDRSRERYLERLGHTAITVTDGEEALRRLDHGTRANLVVEVSDTGDLPVDLVHAGLAHPNCKNVALVVPPKRLRLARTTFDEGRIAVVDSHATGDEILYSFHQIESGALERRAAARLLFGTEVTFRDVAGAHADIAFTHNVSEGGLYVRTLAQPTSDRVWIELTPPRMLQPVQFIGRVAWRTPVSRFRFGGAPPGFGVQIIDGAQRSILEWERGCALLARYCGG